MAIANRETESESDIVPNKRRRRTPPEARAEILEATSDLLTSTPVSEITINSIMARTTLSRKSFYVYFRDREDAIRSLVAPLRTAADAAIAEWRRSPDMVRSGRAALRSAAMLYQQHGLVLRALADAALHDAEAAQVWRAFNEPLITVAMEKIAEATRVGASEGLDPELTARALVAMNVQFFFNQLVESPAADLDRIVDTLAVIWERTIFLRHPIPD